MTRGTRLWIEGLMRAFFSGLSGTLGVAAVEPHLFDTGNAQKLALIGLIIGGIQVLQFLSQKPLPPTNGDDGGGHDGGGGSQVSPLTGAFRSLLNTGDGMKKAALVAVILAGSLAMGCGGRLATIPAVPEIVPNVEQDVRAGAIKALGILEASGVVAEKASAVVSEAAASGAVPASAQGPIRAGFRALADTADAAISTIETGAVTDWAELRALIDPVLANVQRLIDTVQTLGPDVKDRVIAFLQAAYDIILQLWQPGVPRDLALEGGR